MAELAKPALPCKYIPVTNRTKPVASNNTKAHDKYNPNACVGSGISRRGNPSYSTQMDSRMPNPQVTYGFMPANGSSRRSRNIGLSP